MTVQVMMTMPELPEGWEYTGEYRPVVNGDFRCITELSVAEWKAESPTSNPYPIVRRIYIPEPWIKDGWVWPNCSEWYWSAMKPYASPETAHGNNWLSGSPSDCLTRSTNFTPPPERRPYKVDRKVVPQ